VDFLLNVGIAKCLHDSDLLKQNARTLTWVRQDGISLGQELVTANALETLFTSDLKKKKKKERKPQLVKSDILGTVSMGVGAVLGL